MNDNTFLWNKTLSVSAELTTAQEIVFLRCFEIHGLIIDHIKMDLFHSVIVPGLESRHFVHSKLGSITELQPQRT